MREQWATQTGDIITLAQFDEFAILAPVVLITKPFARKFSQIMDEEGISLADLLAGLDQERQKSYDLAQSNEQ